jgi:hypothetical protein
MKSKEEIEKLLESFGKAWPADSSLAERVVREIQSGRMRPKSSNRRRIIMKALIGIAGCVAIFVAIWWGAIDNHNSLYAQVMDAVHKARTVHVIHYFRPKPEAEPQKDMEEWYAKDVGFRREIYILGTSGIATNEAVWSYNKKQNIASRSKSEGIDKTAPPNFLDEIDQTAQHLQNEFERYPAGDKEIDGVPCKAFRLSKLDRYTEPMKTWITSGKRQLLIYIDQQSRPIRSEDQTKENNQWNTNSYVSLVYDEPFDPALFRPNFGKDVKIVDADKMFDEFFDLKKAVYTEQRGGIIFAIHRIERFENGGVMFVSSVRGTEETLKKFPLTTFDETFRSRSMAEGPACNQWSHYGADGFHKVLAYGGYQGISVTWWAVIPPNAKPDYLEAAPNKIRLHVGVTPRLKFRDSLTEKQIRAFESGWDIVVDSPQLTTIPTVEEIAKSVYADLAALKAVSIEYLTFFGDKYPASDSDNDIFDSEHEGGGKIEEISSDEYAKKIVRDVKWVYERAINAQIDEQFKPENFQKNPEAMLDDHGNLICIRVAIDLMYNPAVNDATLERVAKDEATLEHPATRDRVTELFLQGTHITDEGLKHLISFKKLQILHLEDTSITDAGLKHLTGLSNLKQLYLTDTKVTADSVEMLKRAITGIKIEWKEKDRD